MLKFLAEKNVSSFYRQKLLTIFSAKYIRILYIDFVCVEVLRPSQPNGVMSSAVSLPNHTFTGQA